jgi:hypothetical protein
MIDTTKENLKWVRVYLSERKETMFCTCGYNTSQKRGFANPYEAFEKGIRWMARRDRENGRTPDPANAYYFCSRCAVWCTGRMRPTRDGSYPEPNFERLQNFTEHPSNYGWLPSDFGR